MRNSDELFGLEVQAQREQKGWSMTEFAALLSAAGLTNFHPTTIGRLERGERPVRLSEAVVIAEVLGSKLDDLVVEPMAGYEDVRWAINSLETMSKKAAKCVNLASFYREELERDLGTLTAALAAGKISEEHIEGAQAACSQAEAMLESDRVKFWREKLEALTMEERQALYSTDLDFKTI